MSSFFRFIFTSLLIAGIGIFAIYLYLIFSERTSTPYFVFFNGNLYGRLIMFGSIVVGALGLKITDAFDEYEYESDGYDNDYESQDYGSYGSSDSYGEDCTSDNGSNTYELVTSRRYYSDGSCVGYSVGDRHYDSDGNPAGYDVGNSHYDRDGNPTGYRVGDREYDRDGNSVGYWVGDTFYDSDGNRYY